MNYLISSMVMILVTAWPLAGCAPPPMASPASCGDGVVDELAGEQCDDAGDTAMCDRDCTLVECGDGYVNTVAGESCEDGNQVSGDGCRASCERERCGDGMHDPGEACDDGNHVSGDGCSSDCGSDETCGSGIVDPGEACDDGNDVSGDGCSSDCGSDETCGNGMVDPGERCDDGGQVSGDGCSADCGSDEICGNGIVDPAAGEECDDGGQVSGDGCSAACWLELCGNDTVDSGEECDDGNAEDSDWCLPTCEDPSCDDGIRNGDEQDVDCGGECGTCVERMIVAGMLHTCALLQTGAVRCWGWGAEGQLGYGNKKSIGDNEAPAMAGDVDVGGDVVELAAGAYHTCALLETGAVRCWGRGLEGQLGYGNIDNIDNINIGDDEVPAMAGDVDVGGVVVQLAAGAFHTCALLDTGTVRCWGYGVQGRLGYGNTSSIGDDETPATAGDVNVGGDVVQLVAGWAHTCALLSTGAVRCWGYAFHGQLGYGNQHNIGDNEVPAAAGPVNVGGYVMQLAAGANHTCAWLSTGAVRCWGDAFYGQLGYGNTNNIGDWVFGMPPGNVKVGGFVAQLAAGQYHTCALLGADMVRCWGLSSSGQLGYGNTENIGDNELPETTNDVNLGGAVVQLAGGGAHTCAMLETGAVRCWGGAQFGQLGHGNTFNIGDDEDPASAGDVPYR